MSQILIIPRGAVTVRFIDVPSLDKIEIENMVEFQLLKEIPYPKEDMITGYRNLGSFKEGFSSVMLAVVKKQVILDMLKQKEDEGIAIESVRLFTELLYLSLMERKVIMKDKVNLVIHIDEEESEFLVISGDKLIFSRSFKNSTTFFDEVDRSILVYRRDRENPEINRIIVTHPSFVDIEHVKNDISRHFSSAVIFDEYSLDLAEYGPGASIELMPREVSEKKLGMEKRHEKTSRLFLSSLIALLIMAYSGYKIYTLDMQAKLLSSDLARLTPEVSRLEVFLEKSKTAERHKEEGDKIAVILQKSFSLIPGDINIESVTYDGKDLFFFKGYSDANSNVYNFVKKLEGSLLFEKVGIKYTAKKKVKNVELTDFNIECSIDMALPYR